MATNPPKFDYRDILRDELANRCRQNARYSLRAFARDLELSPSRLSEILNGKQGMSRRSAGRVAERLGFGKSETDRFCDLVDAAHARSYRDRQMARIRLKKYAFDNGMHRLQLDAFRAISDWYHLGILELLQIEGNRGDPDWLARNLGITVVEAKLAIERLIRLGLVEFVDETAQLTHKRGFIPSDVPSDSIKKFHSQIIQKSLSALYTQSVNRREYSSQVMAVDTSKLESAKKFIRDFQHKFCKDMADAETKNGLYCLAIQFFDLQEGGSHAGSKPN